MFEYARRGRDCPRIKALVRVIMGRIRARVWGQAAHTCLHSNQPRLAVADQLNREVQQRQSRFGKNHRFVKFLAIGQQENCEL